MVSVDFLFRFAGGFGSLFCFVSLFRFSGLVSVFLVLAHFRTVHEIDNMASRFPESLSKAQISEINEKATPINTKKATKCGLGVFQGKYLFLRARATG